MKKKDWQCPYCEQAYLIHPDANPEMCPECVSRLELRDKPNVLPRNHLSKEKKPVSTRTSTWPLKVIGLMVVSVFVLIAIVNWPRNRPLPPMTDSRPILDDPGSVLRQQPQEPQQPAKTFRDSLEEKLSTLGVIEVNDTKFVRANLVVLNRSVTLMIWFDSGRLVSAQANCQIPKSTTDLADLSRVSEIVFRPIIGDAAASRLSVWLESITDTASSTSIGSDLKAFYESGVTTRIVSVRMN